MSLHRGKEYSYPRARKFSLPAQRKGARNFHRMMQKMLATLLSGARCRSLLN